MTTLIQMADIPTSLMLVQSWPGRIHLPVPCPGHQPLELLPEKVWVSPKGSLKGRPTADPSGSQGAEEGSHLRALVASTHGDEGGGGTEEPVQEGSQGSRAGTRGGPVQEEAGKVGGGQGDVILTSRRVGDITVGEDKRTRPPKGDMCTAEHTATFRIKPGKTKEKREKM